MNKKILYVRSAPYDVDINGYNIQEIGLGKAFCELGYDFDFIAFKKSSPYRNIIFYNNGTNIARYIEKPRIRVDRCGINFNVCKKEFLKRYDIIICSEYNQIESYLISRNTKNAVIYSGPYYNIFLLKFLSYIYDAIFTKLIDRNVRCIFVKSELAHLFLKKKGYTKLYTLGVALDTLRFDNEKIIKPETHKLIDYMTCNRCILYVGALSDRKNLPFLLDTYQKVLEKEPDVKFIMIGKSVINPIKKLFGEKDSDYERKCIAKIPQKVKDGIVRIQRIDNPQLKFIYPLAKAFLLPSKMEIFGMVLLEAMYLKTPVITSYNGGSATLIEGKETGLIVKDFNPDLWADAIRKYLNNPLYVEKVKKNAHNLIASQFNWKNLANQIISIFNNGLGKQ